MTKFWIETNACLHAYRRSIKCISCLCPFTEGLASLFVFFCTIQDEARLRQKLAKLINKNVTYETEKSTPKTGIVRAN